MSNNTTSEQQFNIIISGKFLANTDPQQAIGDFARAFKIDHAKAAAVFQQAPSVVKKDVGEDVAKKFLAALEKMGVECKAVPSGSVIANAAEQAPPSPAEPPGSARTRINPVVEPEHYQGLPFNIIGRPDYAYLSVKIPANQTLKVEASGMAAMDSHIRMKTKMKGGFGRLLTGENLFINEFTAENAPGEIGIAPATPGDLCHQYLDGNTLFLQNSAFVAASMDVAVETKWQGMVKGFFSGENLFLIRCSGQGDLWFNTYGAMIEIDINGDYVVDTGNIVAFTEGLEYKITKVGGYKSLFFSGEGFVCRFSGRGKVWIQTRNVAGFAAWARMFRPAK